MSVVVVAIGVGLMVLSYLPIRASKPVQVNWGKPTTVERFNWVVSAKAFQKAVTQKKTQSIFERVTNVNVALMAGLTPIAVLLGFVGLYLLCRRQETRFEGATLVGLLLPNIMGPVLIGFDPFNPDAHGYLATSGVVLACGAAFMIELTYTTLEERWTLGKVWRERAVAMVSAVAASALVLFQILNPMQPMALQTHWSAEETAREILDQPRGAVQFSSYFQTLFSGWAMQVVGGYRTDVDVIHRNFLTQTGYIDGLDATKRKILQRLKVDQGKTLELPSEGLRTIAVERPVVIELDLNLNEKLWGELSPAGLMTHYGVAVQDHQARVERWMKRLEGDPDSETRRAILWYQYLWSKFACKRGPRELAKFHLAQAMKVGPEAQGLAELRRICGDGSVLIEVIRR